MNFLDNSIDWIIDSINWSLNDQLFSFLI